MVAHAWSLRIALAGDGTEDRYQRGLDLSDRLSDRVLFSAPYPWGGGSGRKEGITAGVDLIERGGIVVVEVQYVAHMYSRSAIS